LYKVLILFFIIPHLRNNLYNNWNYRIYSIWC